MVCNRCIMAIKFELIKFGIVPVYVNLGEIELENELTAFQCDKFNSVLQFMVLKDLIKMIFK